MVSGYRLSIRTLRAWAIKVSHGGCTKLKKLVILGARCWRIRTSCGSRSRILGHTSHTALRSAEAFEGWRHGWHFAQNDPDGSPHVFDVNRNDDGLWLNTNDGRPDNEWNPDNRFVFLRPRNSHHTLCTTAREGGCAFSRWRNTDNGKYSHPKVLTKVG